jgi:hypothetical protein
MIFCGLVGATIAGLLIDYTKKFKEITVVTLALAILCLIWFTEVTLHITPVVLAPFVKICVLIQGFHPEIQSIAVSLFILGKDQRL